MDVEELLREIREGRIEPERVVCSLFAQLQQANRKIAELEKRLGEKSKHPTEPYSVESEIKRQEERGKKFSKPKKCTRRGRVKSQKKLSSCTRTEKVYPVGVPEEECYLSHTRPVWRLIDGQATRIAYEIYRGGPKHAYGKIPGVIGRGEFGSEIMVAIAFQVYIVGLSFDKVCLILGFFNNLQLRKSQAEAMLKQLARHWEKDFDYLILLLANSAVVHTDETSWSINSVWAFLSEHARVLLFGVHKDAATLAKILDPLVFAGIVSSDDAAVYANFTHAQKCWAHLLRKAIKLTLLEPQNEMYRNFTDRLLEIYREACRVQRDQRYSNAGRASKVAELDDQIFDLCGPVWFAELPKLTGTEDDFRLLCNELMRLMLAQELFTFVTAPPVTKPNGETQPVAGTNNESERELRDPGICRETGQSWTPFLRQLL
jgi:transposase